MSNNPHKAEEAGREECVICQRPSAIDADWALNAALPSDREDAEAERLGLNKLCWEPESDDCLAEAIERGRPTNYPAAMEDLNALESSIQGLVTAVEAVTSELVDAGLNRRLPDNDRNREKLEALADALASFKQEVE